MKKIIRAAFAAFAFATTALAESMPQGAFDTCQGGDLTIHVSGWAYDPDASSQSIDVYVNIYTDSDCNSLYSFHRLTANVSRPDVNQAKGITGNHGFNADISVPAGTYWVQIMAFDKTANLPYEISQQVPEPPPIPTASHPSPTGTPLPLESTPAPVPAPAIALTPTSAPSQAPSAPRTIPSAAPSTVPATR